MGFPASLKTRCCTAKMVFEPPPEINVKVHPRNKIVLTFTLHLATNIKFGEPAFDLRWRGGKDVKHMSCSERTFEIQQETSVVAFDFDFPEHLSKVTAECALNMYDSYTRQNGQVRKVQHVFFSKDTLPIINDTVTLKIPKVFPHASE